MEQVSLLKWRSCRYWGQGGHDPGPVSLPLMAKVGAAGEVEAGRKLQSSPPAPASTLQPAGQAPSLRGRELPCCLEPVRASPPPGLAPGFIKCQAFCASKRLNTMWFSSVSVPREHRKITSGDAPPPGLACGSAPRPWSEALDCGPWLPWGEDGASVAGGEWGWGSPPGR